MKTFLHGVMNNICGGRNEDPDHDYSQTK